MESDDLPQDEEPSESEDSEISFDSADFEASVVTSREALEAADATRRENRLTIDFTGREELLEEIRKAAAEDLRTVENQVLYHLIHNFER